MVVLGRGGAMSRMCLRTAATCSLVVVLTSAEAWAQEARWFTEFGIGQAATLDQAAAWSGLSSGHVAGGRAFSSTLSGTLALSFDKLVYDVHRLSDLFPADSIRSPEGLAQVLGVTAGVEWAYPLQRGVRPSIGVGVNYLRRELMSPGFFPHALGCVVEGDKARVSRCAEYQRDLEITGDGVGLNGSAGIALALGTRQELGVQLRVARNVLGSPLGVLSGRIRYRGYF
jgi:hypothetical protein